MWLMSDDSDPWERHDHLLKDIDALLPEIREQAMFVATTSEIATGFGIRQYRSFDMWGGRSYPEIPNNLLFPKDFRWPVDIVGPRKTTHTQSVCAKTLIRPGSYMEALPIRHCVQKLHLLARSPDRT